MSNWSKLLEDIIWAKHVISVIQWGVCNGCVCAFVFGGGHSFQTDASRGKRKKSLNEQQLLWILVLTRQMKIARCLNFVAEAINERYLPWVMPNSCRWLNLVEARAQAPVVAFSVSMLLGSTIQCKTPLSFLAWLSSLTNRGSQEILWRLAWSICHFFKC